VAVVSVLFIVILSLVLVVLYLISESEVETKLEVPSREESFESTEDEDESDVPNNSTLTVGGEIDIRAMGPTADYTVLVYVVGSDLESKYYLATADFKEMVQGNPNDSINVIIESGGAKAKPIEGKRDIDFRTVKHLQVTGDGLEELEDLGKINMGKPETLSDFIIWGTASYPAEKYVLILWNHGSGVNGFGIDEVSRDHLSLDELHDALEEAKQATEVNFEIIGFDACLMATLEVANILKDYANYMVASEEFEVGYGWDYNALISSLNEDPTQTGAELGTVIADSFFADTVAKSSKGHDLSRITTLSVVDLSKIPALNESINALTADIETNIAEKDMPKFSRALDDAERYGIVKGKDSGHMDVENFAEKIAKFLPEFKTLADQVKSDVEDAVVYAVQGASRQSAHGLSVYMPASSDAVSTNYRYGDVASANQFYVDYLFGDNEAPPQKLTHNNTLISGTYSGDDIYELHVYFTDGLHENGLVKIVSSDEFDPDDPDWGFTYGNIEYDWDTTIPSICSKDECIPVFVEWVWGDESDMAYIPVEIERDGEFIEADLLYDISIVEEEVFIGVYPQAEEGVFEKNMLQLQHGDIIHPYMKIVHWHSGESMLVPEDDHSIVVDEYFFTSEFWQSYDGPWYVVVEICDFADNCSNSDFFEIEVEGDYKFFE